MSEAAPPTQGSNPFSVRAVLALVVFGAAMFVALMWMVGAGMASGPVNDGGNHASGRGLNGFAAFSRLLEKQGYAVSQSRSTGGGAQAGLLVLTPPHGTPAEEINALILQRRSDGPTLLVLPKWQAVPVPPGMAGAEAKSGWVMLAGIRRPRWANGIDAIGPLDVQQDKDGSARWSGFGLAGALPDPKAVQSLSSGRLVSLVEDTRGQVLAAYLDDGSDYPALSAAAKSSPSRISGSDLYPVVVVAEPDLLDNYGFARRENAGLAMALVAAATDGERMPVTFDLTLNGHARTANLLTLAFTPPFLAATLCLLLAALAVGWRAFLRFGPARKENRAIAFGKRALVANASGFVRRTRRLHLLSGPYVDSARERIVRALALPRTSDTKATDETIDRAVEVRSPGAQPFSRIAARLRNANSQHEAVKAARDLYVLERKLIR